jgi:hypothetical protein
MNGFAKYFIFVAIAELFWSTVNLRLGLLDYFALFFIFGIVSLVLAIGFEYFENLENVKAGGRDG